MPAAPRHPLPRVPFGCKHHMPERAAAGQVCKWRVVMFACLHQWLLPLCAPCSPELQVPHERALPLLNTAKVASAEVVMLRKPLAASTCGTPRAAGFSPTTGAGVGKSPPMEPLPSWPRELEPQHTTCAKVMRKTRNTQAGAGGPGTHHTCHAVPHSRTHAHAMLNRMVQHTHRVVGQHGARILVLGH